MSPLLETRLYSNLLSLATRLFHLVHTLSFLAFVPLALFLLSLPDFDFKKKASSLEQRWECLFSSTCWTLRSHQENKEGKRPKLLNKP